MGACLRHGQVTLRGTRVNPALPWLGAVLVNTRGERFVDEQAHGYSGLAGVVQAQPGERAVMVWDDEADATAQHSEMMRESARRPGRCARPPDVDCPRRRAGPRRRRPVHRPRAAARTARAGGPVPLRLAHPRGPHHPGWRRRRPDRARAASPTARPCPGCEPAAASPSAWPARTPAATARATACCPRSGWAGSSATRLARRPHIMYVAGEGVEVGLVARVSSSRPSCSATEAAACCICATQPPHLGTRHALRQLAGPQAP